MKYLPLAALLLLAAVPSYAQQQELNLKLTTTEADVIWKGLRKLSVDEVEVLMVKIRQQVAEQTQPKPVEAPNKVEPKKE